MRGALLAATSALAVAFAVASPASAADVPRWCGTDRVAFDRPDAVAGYQTHVIYAVPSDGTERFDEVVVQIARDIAAVEEWWRAQDAGHAPRFDLFAAACESTFGRLDVSNVRLPHDSGHYSDPGSRFDRLQESLTSGAGAFTDPDKKYLVYFDAPAPPRSSCGQANILRGGGREAFAFLYLGSSCGRFFGTGARFAVTAAHELVHALGAFLATATGERGPNACPDDRFHACDYAFDVIATGIEGRATLNDVQLDYGRNDYYGHSGPWWDVQDSLFLARLQVADQSPPSGPASVTATSEGSAVKVSWPAATDASELTYRVYRDGELVRQTNDREYMDAAEIGEVRVYGVRAADVYGQLSPRMTVRFKVGFGIVDEAGRLVRDTVRPSDVDPVRVRYRNKRTARIQWAAAVDPGGLRAYRVLRNGRLFRTVTARFVDVPRRLKGAWRVQAVDTAGNVGPLSDPVRVR